VCARLAADDVDFATMIFSKIIDNSLHPSRDLKRLFDLVRVRAFIEEALPRAAPRRRRRLLLVLHNFFGIGSIEELSWRR
jgi:type II secretory pathway component PulJ